MTLSHKYSPSPLAGEGCGALASGSELRRSWMRGGAATAAHARQSVRLPLDRSAYALRAYGATPHPTSPKLTTFAKASYPSPARGEGKLDWGSVPLWVHP